MSEHIYLYAFTWADCPDLKIRRGVDARFNVGLIRQGRLAAVTSRVGMDRFGQERFEAKTVEDLQWLRCLTLRHREIIGEVVAHGAVMPLQVGVLFHDRASLLWRMSRCEAKVADFLHDLGDRQEWRVTVFVHDGEAARNASHQVPPPPHFCAQRDATTQDVAGTQAHNTGPCDAQAHVQAAIDEIKATLAKHADRCCVCSLPNVLTKRRKRLIYNAAYLLPRAALGSWSTAVGRLQGANHPKGLLLQVTGPLPPYHFCPAVEMSELRLQEPAGADNIQCNWKNGILEVRLQQ